jgi:hypothetical protein
MAQLNSFHNNYKPLISLKFILYLINFRLINYNNFLIKIKIK